MRIPIHSFRWVVPISRAYGLQWIMKQFSREFSINPLTGESRADNDDDDDADDDVTRSRTRTRTRSKKQTEKNRTRSPNGRSYETRPGVTARRRRRVHFYTERVRVSIWAHSRANIMSDEKCLKISINVSPRLGRFSFTSTHLHERMSAHIHLPFDYLNLFKLSALPQRVCVRAGEFLWYCAKTAKNVAT